MVPSLELSRRALLELAGTTLASRFPGSRRSVPVHVGYAEPTGHRTAMSLASETIRDHGFDAVTVRVDREAIVRLRSREDVRYVEPVEPVFSLASAGKSAEPMDGGIDRVDADVAHENGATGAGADVGVIDSGIDDGHEALKGPLAGGTSFVPSGLFDFTPWDDDYGHGTHCAGLVSADGPHGVCTEANLHAVKVLNGKGKGTTADLAAGIEHVADQGWDVANLSVGTAKSKVIADACAYAAEKDVVLVAAAGPEKRGYPARYDECIAVGAIDAEGSIPDFSPTDGSVDLLAPGVSIRSSVPGGYATRSGTSAACAYVAGAAALLAAKGYGRNEIEGRLLGNTEVLTAPLPAQGDGLLDVAAALGYDSGDDASGSGSESDGT